MLQIRPKHLQLLTVLIAAALAGCSGGDDGEPPEQADTAQTATAPADLQSDTVPTPAVDTIQHFGRRGGRPWGNAQSALARLAFAGGAASATEEILVCDRGSGCPRIIATIYPEAGSHRLRRGHFPGSMRIIAKVVLESPGSVPVMGFTADNRDRTAYLVTIGADSAVFIYRTQTGDIGMSPRWRFGMVPDNTNSATPRASWRSRAHGKRGGDSIIIHHLSSPWVACVQGCCMAAPHET